MLQIITGRFFKTNELNRTQQRTVLYSNYRVNSCIDTLVGTYSPAASASDVATGVYQVEQRLEAVGADGSVRTIIAVHPEALAQDFAALFSFCLRVTCTLDPALVSRLTQSNRPPIGAGSHPSQLVERIFDREVWSSQGDLGALPKFVADLVQLERVRYKAVMRAIQRYVVGLHRIGDDPALSYTLLVASIESLAQDFDRFQVSWRDYDPEKRVRIDRALADADSATREAVQSAILEIEHVAMGRRFQEFALAHLPPSFYREEAKAREGAARACEMAPALSRAYAFRSRLVHRLEELPVLLALPLEGREIVEVDRKPALTFRGLERVAHRVIMRFVESSPKLDTEDFNYWADIPNTFSAPMIPRYWIWKAENYHVRNARIFLSGFLSELESVLLGHEKRLTDIHNVLEKIEQQLPAVAPKNGLPMISLYLLYHRHLPEEWHRPEAAAFLEQHAFLLNSPSIESLICHTILSQATGWEPAEQEEMRKEYMDQRYQKNSLKLGPVLESAVTLETAEAFRLKGNCEQARFLLSSAVENLPGHAKLSDLEQKWLAGEVGPIRWRDVLLPVQNFEEGGTDRSLIG